MTWLVMLALCRGFPPPKQQTRRHVARHVGVLALTCWQHQALPAPQMPCQCRVSMTFTQHVGGAMAFGEVCWAATEGSGSAGPRRQQQKMSNEGDNVDIGHCATRGEVDTLGQTSRDDKMQHDDATIKQAGVTRCVRGRGTMTRQDKTRQREDVTTRRCNDATARQRRDERDDQRHNTAQ